MKYKEEHIVTIEMTMEMMVAITKALKVFVPKVGSDNITLTGTSSIDLSREEEREIERFVDFIDN